MATGTQVDIANRALLAVGARTQVSSINPSDGSVEANAISVLWTPTFESLARTAPWGCLGKQVALSLVAAAQGTPENVDGTTLPLPPTPYLYAYAYPVDCLFFRYIVPSFPANTGTDIPQTTINNSAATWLPSGGQIVFKLSTFQLTPTSQPIQVILTNQDQAQGVYTANLPNPSLWDSLFQAAMVASLGAFLVPALSLNLALLDRQVKAAESIIAQARAWDANEGVTSMDHTPDWIQARAGGSGYGWGWGYLGSSWYGSFYNMNWPMGGDGSYGT